MDDYGPYRLCAMSNRRFKCFAKETHHRAPDLTKQTTIE